MTNQSSFSRYYTYIKPITSAPVVKNYAPTFFALITMTVFILFAIKPTVETITVLQKKLVDYQQILKEINKKVDDLSLGKKNYDQLDPSIKRKIQAAIPNSPTLTSLIQTLEQSAKTNQASISALQIQPLELDAKTNSANSSGTLTEISFIFNTSGSYQSLISLLQDIRSSARLFSIDSVVMSKREEGNFLTMSINGKVYFIK